MKEHNKYKNKDDEVDWDGLFDRHSFKILFQNLGVDAVDIGERLDYIMEASLSIEKNRFWKELKKGFQSQFGKIKVKDYVIRQEQNEIIDKQKKEIKDLNVTIEKLQDVLE